MECPHLDENVKILTPCLALQGAPTPWTCAACQTEKCPWICLHCGLVSCGRYVNGHAKAHHAERQPQHCLCLDCETWAVYCYLCDEFVVNDTETGLIDKARKYLQEILNSSEARAETQSGEDEQELGEEGESKAMVVADSLSTLANQGTSAANTGGTASTDAQPASTDTQPANNTDAQSANSTVANTAGAVSPVAASSVEASLSGHANPLTGPANLTAGPANPTTGPVSAPASPSASSKASTNGSDTQSSSKENRQTRRRGSSDSRENNRKRLKTDDSCSKSKVKAKTPGLRNLGNTCFMNAVLQSLSNIQSFCGYIKQLPSLEHKLNKKKIQTRSCKDGEDIFVVEELRKTLVALWGGSKSAISPECLFSVIWKVVPRFRGYQQQDAHEFMRYLLDRLHTELLTLLPYPNSSSPYIGPKGKSTIVTTIFGGILQNEVTCLSCCTESKKHDPFLDLSLDIPSRFTSKCPSPKNGEPICHIHDCLSSFTEIEELEETELYMCNNCKKRQRSTKKFWIRRLPNVLCLHLKRFRWSTYFRVKVDTYIDFPLQGLDMNKYMLNNLHETRNSCSGSNEYDLAAVIVHHGSGAGSGHYTSYAIHEGRWYHFNDSTVSCVDEETVRRCKAYILFYVKRDIKVPHYFSPDAPAPAGQEHACH